MFGRLGQLAPMIPLLEKLNLESMALIIKFATKASESGDPNKFVLDSMKKILSEEEIRQVRVKVVGEQGIEKA